MRPLADLLRIIETKILQPNGDLIKKYKALYDTGGKKAESEFAESLQQTMQKLGFHATDQINPRLISIDGLAKAMQQASSETKAKAAGGGGGESKKSEVRKIKLSEWVSLVLHTGADVIESVDEDGEEKHLVHTRKLLQGICDILIGDARVMEEQRATKVAPSKPDAKLFAICRDLQRVIQEEVEIAPLKQGNDGEAKLVATSPRRDYGQWLAGALQDFGLKQDVPCAPELFEKLLSKYKEFFGWDIDAATIKRWVKLVHGSAKTIGEVEVRAFVEGRSGWLSEATAENKADAAAVKPTEGWFADMQTGDPDADKLLLRVHGQQRMLGLAFSDAHAGLRRALQRHDQNLCGMITRTDFKAALANVHCADAIETNKHFSVQEQQAALSFFERGSLAGGADKGGSVPTINYELFLQALRRAWLTQPPHGTVGSTTGSRKLDVQLAVIKRELRKAAARTLKDRNLATPLSVFREVRGPARPRRASIFVIAAATCVSQVDPSRVRSFIANHRLFSHDTRHTSCFFCFHPNA